MNEQEKKEKREFLEAYEDLLKVNHILLSKHSNSRKVIDNCPEDFFIKQLFQIKKIEDLVKNAEAFAKVLEFRDRHKGELYKETINLINKFKPLYHAN